MKKQIITEQLPDSIQSRHSGFRQEFNKKIYILELDFEMNGTFVLFQCTKWWLHTNPFLTNLKQQSSWSRQRRRGRHCRLPGKRIGFLKASRCIGNTCWRKPRDEATLLFEAVASVCNMNLQCICIHMHALAHSACNFLDFTHKQEKK